MHCGGEIHRLIRDAEQAVKPLLASLPALSAMDPAMPTTGTP